MRYLLVLARFFATCGCLAIVVSLMALPAAHAALPEVTDIAAKLHARATGDAYQTVRGLAICVQTAKGDWFPWYAAHPDLREAPRAQCRVPAGAKFIYPMVPLAWKPCFKGCATFSGATRIVWQPSGLGDLCGYMFGDYYSVTRPDGHRQKFYVFVRLSKPRSVRFNACPFDHWKRTAMAFQYASVVPLFSVALDDGTSIVWYSYNNAHPVLLRMRGVPSAPWTNHGDVFILPPEAIAPELAAAGDQPYARYAALQSALQSLKEAGK